MDEEIKRAICHEAAHAVVALALGFHVESIQLSKGFPNMSCELDSNQKGQEERCIVLAGGIAGEMMYYGDFNKEASRRDQTMIAQRGGGSIESYLSKAQSILAQNRQSLIQLRKRLELAWVIAATGSAFESGPDSFELLSRVELEDIWDTRENKA